MTRLLAPVLLLAVAALAPGPLAARQATDALLPDTVFTPPGGPRLVLLGTPGSGTAALRLHVPFREGAAEAGVGRLLRELTLERMRGLARPVGARVSVTRSPWGLAYAVEGAVADFEYLAYLLRQAVSRPPVEDVPLTRARQRLEAEVARGAETPAGRLVTRLRRAAAPEVPLAEGTPASLAGLDADRIVAAWRRSHQGRAMTLVVSAGVIPEVVLAATRGLGSPDPAATGPENTPTPPGDEGGDIQSLRSWYGHVWTGGSPGSPLGPVTALLVEEALPRQVDGVEIVLQLRALPDRWALMVLGAAYRDDLPTMRRIVSGALAAVEGRLDAEATARATARVRRDLLYRARTPLGLVSAVGRAMEPAGDPGAAARYLAALDQVDQATVRAFLAELRADGGASAEVRP